MTSSLRRRLLGQESESRDRTPSPAVPVRTPSALSVLYDQHKGISSSASLGKQRSRSLGDAHADVDAPATSLLQNETPQNDDDDGANGFMDEIVGVPAQKLEQINEHLKKKRPRGSKRQKAWVFGLGGLVGVLFSIFWLGVRQDVIDLSGIGDFSLSVNVDALLDVLPARLVRDAQEMQQSERDAVNYDSFSVGLHAKSQGVSADHPVVMIPGVISTGLESWGTEPKSRQYFRKRLWGSWTMMRALVLDQACWKAHIMVDKHTGLDPPGIKLRAAQGFDATDFFITGFWIWNKILENLATIGYDPSNAFTAAYDWRLSYSNMEVRDKFFSRLKSNIEEIYHEKGRKAVLLSHSMGSQVLFYFFHWVEAEGYGNGGSDWVEKYVDSWINVSGCMLGATKGIPAVLSGEMKDTAQLNAFAVYGLEKFLSRHERAEIFRAMPGISSMLPLGGDAVWGDSSGAPDDRPGQLNTFGRFITFRNPDGSSLPRDHIQNLTVAESIPYLLNHSEDWYREMVRRNYSHGVAHTREEVEANELDPRKWINPLETRLPLAPSLKIYCFYGIGKDTERAYFYRHDKDPLTKTNVTIDTSFTASTRELTGHDPASNETLHSDVPWADRGIIMGEGDGTVNLLSSGYMCAKGWKSIKRYNPAGAKVTLYEMPHEPDRFNPRGGPNTADHVDILGRAGLNELILKVAGGKGDDIEENIKSNILEYAEKVKIYDEE